MAPSAESNPALEYATSSGSKIPSRPRSVDQKKTVTFAVNYELSMVDRFWHSTSSSCLKPPAPDVKSLPQPTTPHCETRLRNGCSSNSTTVTPVPTSEAPGSTPPTIISLRRRGSNLENSAPNVLRGSNNKKNKEADESSVKMEWVIATKPLPSPSQSFSSNSSSTRSGVRTRGKRVSIAMKDEAEEQDDPSQVKRRSSRGTKKRESSLVTARVRYDMEAVPYVRRNREFLKSFPSWPLVTSSSKTATTTAPQPQRRSSRLTKEEDAEDATTNVPLAVVNPSEPPPQACQSCSLVRPAPFEGSSVVWIPDKRMHWEHSVSEMTAVCTSAALRKHTGDKPFIAPLSRDYIKDRIDIDDPLNGYQIRHQTGGWLQGFILWTNFTTWTHFFHWDSLHSVSGVKPQDDSPSTIAAGWSTVDMDGSLGQRLEQEPRSGDPADSGIVFESIAEIGLLGGLACGEELLRMALDSILQHRQYKYVVLQATSGSRSFYERFGFRRVGAVCRYGKQGKNGPEYPTLDSPVQGYRHWTHPNESEKSLDLHGGPSYMMCLELPEDRSVIECSACGSQPSILEEMMKFKVDRKPTVEQIGASSTPAPKKRMKGRNSMSTAPGLPSLAPQDPATPSVMAAAPLSNLVPLRPPYTPLIPSAPSTDTRSTVQPKDVPAKAPAQAQAAPRPKRVYSGLEDLTSTTSDGPRSSKRLRVSVDPLAPPPVPSPRDSLLTPPPKGEQLSYAQKQYHSVWLAVAPQERQPTRRAPRDRTSLGTPKPGGDTTERRTGQSVATNPKVADSAPKASTTPAGKTSGLSKRKVRSTTSTATKATNVSPKAPRRSEKIQSSRVDRSVKSTIEQSKPVAVDKAELRKQKVKSYPRDRIHYYNKVVKLQNSKGKSKYFFVLNYNEPKSMLRLVPMEARGELTGMRQGRPRYQCIIGKTDQNFFNVAASDYEAVPAFMVMKTPLVAQEAWDILV